APGARVLDDRCEVREVAAEPAERHGGGQRDGNRAREDRAEKGVDERRPRGEEDGNAVAAPDPPADEERAPSDRVGKDVLEIARDRGFARVQREEGVATASGRFEGGNERVVRRPGLDRT